MGLYECDKIGTHWTTIYVYNVKMTYFDSFGVERDILQKILKVS